MLSMSAALSLSLFLSLSVFCSLLPDEVLWLPPNILNDLRGMVGRTVLLTQFLGKRWQLIFVQYECRRTGWMDE